jgi:hypothetical protein
VLQLVAPTAVLDVRKPPGKQFKKNDGQREDVGSGSCESRFVLPYLWRAVVFCSVAPQRLAFNRRNVEVDEFNFSPATDYYVIWLYVKVTNASLVVQIAECAHQTVANFACFQGRESNAIPHQIVQVYSVYEIRENSSTGFDFHALLQNQNMLGILARSCNVLVLQSQISEERLGSKGAKSESYVVRIDKKLQSEVCAVYFHVENRVFVFAYVPHHFCFSRLVENCGRSVVLD